MFLYYKNKPQEFYERYHKRSNVETSFSMIKLKFNGYLKTKSFIGQQNEVLLKLIAHNICCIIHEYHENKIESYITTKTPQLVLIRK